MDDLGVPPFYGNHHWAMGQDLGETMRNRHKNVVENLSRPTAMAAFSQLVHGGMINVKPELTKLKSTKHNQRFLK